MTPKAIVIGGGISGLTSAYRLAGLGWDVELVEAREELGGLARSMDLGEGRIERYYHFICGGDEHLLRLAEELGIGGKVRWAAAPMGHYYEGRLRPFSTALDVLRFGPLSLGQRLRLGLESWRAQRRTDWRTLDAITARDWLFDTVGPRVWEVLWRPLLESKFGPYADQVSAAWLWHRMWRVGTSRRSALRPDRMGYFEGGSETLLARLAERVVALGGHVRTGVEAWLLHRGGGGRWTAETSAGGLEADAVVLAVPLPVAAALLREVAPEWSATLAAVPYLGVACGLMRAAAPATPYFWVNVNDPRVDFSGFIEYSNLNRSAEAWGGDVLYVPVYLEQTDQRSASPEEVWARLFREGLGEVSADYVGGVNAEVVSRDEYAQPVCTPGFADRKPPVVGPVEGVYLVEGSQLYPSDRCLSGMIGLAITASRRADERVR